MKLIKMKKAKKIKNKSKGQSSIIDAFLFILVCSSAAGLMIYTAGLYGLNNSKQVSMAYNFEYINNALISMHYMQDISNKFFWNQLSIKLADDSSRIDTQVYLSGNAKNIWGNLTETMPSSHFSMEFKSENTADDFYCIPSNTLLLVTCSADEPYSSNDYTTVFSSSTGLKDENNNKWTIILRAYY